VNRRNSDSRRREIERIAAKGDPQAESQLLMERIRAGELSAERVHAAACLGSKPAILLFGVPTQTTRRDRGPGFMAAFNAMERGEVLAFGTACVMHVEMIWRSEFDSDEIERLVSAEPGTVLENIIGNVGDLTDEVFLQRHLDVAQVGEAARSVYLARLAAGRPGRSMTQNYLQQAVYDRIFTATTQCMSAAGYERAIGRENLALGRIMHDAEQAESAWQHDLLITTLLLGAPLERRVVSDPLGGEIMNPPVSFRVASDRLSTESLDPAEYRRPVFGYHTKIAFRGGLKSLVEWSQTLGVDVRTLKSRLNRGWSVLRAFTTPAQEPGSWDAGQGSRAGMRMLSHGGERLSVVDWANRLGMNESTIHMRLARGATVEEALSPPGGKQRVCSRCGSGDHTAASCDASVYLASDEKRHRELARESAGADFSKTRYVCGRCGLTGHNRRTCRAVQ